MNRRRLFHMLRFSLNQQRTHARRTVLSLSALLAGIATVVVLGAAYRGAELRVVERVRAMGTDLLMIQAAPARIVAGRARLRSSVTTLRPDDAEAIADGTPLARRSATAVIRPMVARWEGRNVPTTLLGTTAGGLEIQGIVAASGRTFDALEERELRRVAVIGATVARNLFGALDPIGETIQLGRVPVEVIGVIRRRGTDVGGSDLDNTVIIPLGTAMRRVLNVPYVDVILLQARSTGDLDSLESAAREVLARRHRKRSGAAEEFVVRNQAVLLRTERGATRALRNLMVTVSGVSLAVGVVGILGIMLLSVRERSGEIALRRAVGAKLKDIRLQFLLESAILSAVGGAAGVAIGLAVAGIAAAVGPWTLAVPWGPALLALVSSIAVGLVVGVVPAVRAARLDPIAGLRRGA